MDRRSVFRGIAAAAASGPLAAAAIAAEPGPALGPQSHVKIRYSGNGPPIILLPGDEPLIVRGRRIGIVRADGEIVLDPGIGLGFYWEGDQINWIVHQQRPFPAGLIITPWMTTEGPAADGKVSERGIDLEFQLPG